MLRAGFARSVKNEELLIDSLRKLVGKDNLHVSNESICFYNFISAFLTRLQVFRNSTMDKAGFQQQIGMFRNAKIIIGLSCACSLLNQK